MEQGQRVGLSPRVNPVSDSGNDVLRGAIRGVKSHVNAIPGGDEGFLGADLYLEVDLLLVGDAIKRPKMLKVIAEIEKTVGEEVNYVVMDSKEYDYRRMMSDRLIRDILDNHHEIVFNTLKK